MKIIKEELEKILSGHRIWLDTGGKEGKQANLWGANLQRADLQESILPFFNLVPEEGSFIAWKKCFGGVLLRLRIPETAKRTSSLVGRKCRASEVEVLEAYNWDGKSDIISQYCSSFKYEVGKTISVSEFDNDIRIECTRGIHFFCD